MISRVDEMVVELIRWVEDYVSSITAALPPKLLLEAPPKLPEEGLLPPNSPPTPAVQG